MKRIEATGDLDLIADGWEILEGCSHIRVLELLVKHRGSPVYEALLDLVQEAVL